MEGMVAPLPMQASSNHATSVVGVGEGEDGERRSEARERSEQFYHNIILLKLA